MDQLSAKKQSEVLKLYLSGASHEAIAAQAGVSKGTVANVVAMLRAGRFPEAADVADQLAALRELAVDLARQKLTPSQAAVGLSVLSRVRALGLEPGDLERWAALCRELTPPGTDVKAFVQAALALEVAKKRTGLEPEELESKVLGLEERLARLEPAAEELGECEQKLRTLEATRQKLAEEVASLEKRALPLRRTVEGQERRESELSSRVQELEARTQTADERLATARKDLQTLSALGCTPEQLSALVHRVGSIADRHHIQAKDLWDRLLTELETMDGVLGLEALVTQRRQDLEDQATALVKVKKERSAVETALARLRQDQTALRSTLAMEERELLSALRALAKAAQDAGVDLKAELRSATAQALGEIQDLREKAMSLGRQVGRLESTVEANEWLRTLLALVAAEAGVSAASTRVVSLAVFRALSSWLHREAGKTVMSTYLKEKVDGVIGDLERWQP